MPREMDYYGLLGVARDASEAEIRERFRTLAREAHPDRAPAAKKAEAEAKFQDLTEAVNVLTRGEPSERRTDFGSCGAACPRRGHGRAETPSSPERRCLQDARFAEAAGNFQLAVGRNPKDVKAQHYLGLASARAGDVRAAVKAIESALAIGNRHNGPRS